jgi:predicted nucleic acid-binding Zn ribbon protein
VFDDDEKLTKKEKRKRKLIAILAAVIAIAVIAVWFILTLKARRAGYAKYM